MKTPTHLNRCLEVLALAMIGEGIAGFVQPRRYSLFWRVGPRWLRACAEMLARHRQATRLFSAAEAAAGLWLALREIEP